jgi:hypothetical protein
VRFETEDHSEVPVGLGGIYCSLDSKRADLDHVGLSSVYTLFTLEKRSGAVKNFRASNSQLCQ